MATITAIKDRIKQLDAAGFQILCDDYLSRIGYPNLVSLGTMAGAQRTTKGTPDTYFCLRDGKYIFAEFTVQRDGLVNKINADIDKCINEKKTHIPLEQISEIVYCHTSANIKPEDDKTLKAKCSSLGILLTLIGIDKLAEDICLQYKTLAKDHLGVSIDTEQIQTVDDFVRQHDANSLAAPLETKFLFRDIELNMIDEALARVNVVVVSGAAGVGKTRLALEYANKYAEENGAQVFCIHSRSLGLYDDLCMYFEKPGKYVVVVDDANQLNTLNLIIDLVNKKGYSIKIIITVRDYATDKVKKDLQGKVQYEQIEIEKLKKEEIISLVKEQYGILNTHWHERIVSIAEGNARMAMFAAKVAKTTDRLASIRDASGLYSEYYGPALRESGIENNTGLLATAGAAAFLNAFHLDHIAPVLAVLETVGIDRDCFVTNLSQLCDMEIVDICHDKAVSFSDQCLANYMLKYVFYEKKTLSLATMIKACFFPYEEKTLYAVNTILDVFHTNDIHAYTCSEVKKVWNELKETEPTAFWTFFKAFYPIDMVESLSILQKVIEDAQPVHILPDEIDTNSGKNYQSVQDDIISILCGFADTTELDSALDLFFRYYLKRPDEFIQFYHAATSAFCINKNSELLVFRTQNEFFAKMFEYSEDWENECILIFFLETAKEFLKLEFTPHSNSRSGEGITIYQISLMLSEGVIKYRNFILEQLEIIAQKGRQPKRLRKVFEDYGKCVNECSVAVLINEAPLVCKVIQAGFSQASLEDCLIVERIASCFDRYGFSSEELKPFLCNPAMDSFRILEGPRFSPDHYYGYEEQLAAHKSILEAYLFSDDSPANAFIHLFDIFCSIRDKSKRQAASAGINKAFQTLLDNSRDCIEAVRYVIASEEYMNLDFLSPVRILLTYLSANELYALICEFSDDSPSINCWKYAFFHELPDECVDNQNVERLMLFLQNNSDRTITVSPYRDVFFLKKYETVDNDIFVKASRIILQKSAYSQFMVKIYFDLLFNPYAGCPFDIVDVFHNDIHLLENIYFNLLRYQSNSDLEGKYLLEIAKADLSFVRRLASELVVDRQSFLRPDLDNRYSALFGLDNFIEALDIIVVEAIQKSEYPTLTVPGIIQKMLTLPENEAQLVERREKWLKHFILENTQSSETMECLFGGISDLPFDLKRGCVKFFIDSNQEIEAFKNLPLLPRYYSALGSLVPVYKEWIAYLESLLPFFHGIRFIEHKKYILDRIECLNQSIIETEIMDIVDK